VTQTSVTLEWPPLELATASLRSLDIYKNGQRLAAIPSPLQNTSTKLSGLDINTDYSFRLVMRTTAGVFQSNLIRVRTHTMTDTSGISVCFGNVQDSVLLENAKLALQEMRAKWSDKIQIDTTHFVCTSPAAASTGAQTSGSISSAPGVEYQRALQLSIPIVQPQWILSCYAEKKMVPISGFYLGTTPSTPMSSTQFTRPHSMSQASLPQSAQAAKAANRASMPAPSRSLTSPDPTPPAISESPSKAVRKTFEPTPEESADGDVSQAAAAQTKPTRNRGPPRARHGTWIENSSSLQLLGLLSRRIRSLAGHMPPTIPRKLGLRQWMSSPHQTQSMKCRRRPLKRNDYQRVTRTVMRTLGKPRRSP